MVAIEQSENIKCCILLHKSPSETLRMLEEAYGNEENAALHVGQPFL
jgi:hypothetical protein